MKEYRGVNNGRNITIAALLSATLIPNKLIKKIKRDVDGKIVLKFKFKFKNYDI